MREGAARIALAAWLVNELDQPLNIPPAANATTCEYRPSTTADDVVRVFFLIHARTPQQIQQIASDVRRTAQIRKLFTYTAPGALIARGTAAQITMASQLIEQLDR